MRVTLSDGTVACLWFGYGTTLQERRDGLHEARTTTAFLGLIYEPGEKPIVMLTAVAECSPKDQFVKETGRLVALRRLSLFARRTAVAEAIPALWAAYLGRKRG